MSLAASVLPAFTPLATCAKCGHDVVRVVYRSDSGHEGCPTAARLQASIGEHLGRICDRCGFEWEEHCVDVVTVEP